MFYPNGCILIMKQHIKTKNIINRYCIFVLLISSKYFFSQPSQHFGVFPTIDHSGTINNKLDYSLYYFGAFNLLNSEVNGVKEKANLFAFYSEQALTFNATANLSFTGSYVYERQRPLESNYRNENRFYVQGAYKYDLNRTSLKHRLRFDGRFIENRITGDSPFTSRLRYQFGIKTPLQKESDKIYFSAYNEFFFDLNKSSTAIYSENWAYAGLGFKLNKSNTIETGPLYIFWVNNKQNDLTNFLYLQVTWVSHLDFRKQKASVN